MEQHSLWHDTPEEAFRDVISALGGFKKVGLALWPAMGMEDAGRKLAHCLDRDKTNKLDLDELATILRMGQAAGCHIGMTYFTRFASYADPVPVDPETETTRLKREFIETSKRLEKLVSAIGRFEGAA